MNTQTAQTEELDYKTLYLNLVASMKSGLAEMEEKEEVWKLQQEKADALHAEYQAKVGTRKTDKAADKSLERFKAALEANRNKHQKMCDKITAKYKAQRAKLIEAQGSASLNL